MKQFYLLVDWNRLRKRIRELECGEEAGEDVFGAIVPIEAPGESSEGKEAE